MYICVESRFFYQNLPDMSWSHPIPPYLRLHLCHNHYKRQLRFNVHNIMFNHLMFTWLISYEFFSFKCWFNFYGDKEHGKTYFISWAVELICDLMACLTHRRLFTLSHGGLRRIEVNPLTNQGLLIYFFFFDFLIH